MLRVPIYGFARRVEDTVARAMAVLTTRPDCTAKTQVIRTPAPALNAGKSGHSRT